MGQPQQFGNGRKRKLVNANIGKGPTKQCRDTILRGNQQQPSHLLDHSQRLIWSGARRNDPCDYRRDLAHTREKASISDKARSTFGHEGAPLDSGSESTRTTWARLRSTSPRDARMQCSQRLKALLAPRSELADDWSRSEK